MLTLHPDKIYIQPVHQGCKFVGTVAKKQRLYIGNRTVGNLYKSLIKINYLAKKQTDEITEIKKTLSTLNSYFGFLKLNRSYNIRKRVVNLINPWWYTYFDVEKDYSKFTLKPKYQFLNKIKG